MVKVATGPKIVERVSDAQRKYDVGKLYLQAKRAHGDIRRRRSADMVPKKRTGCHWTIYFVQQRGGIGPIKIGKSLQVRKRLAELQAFSPVPLVVVATIPHGQSYREKQLHQEFAHLHLRGEWFEPAPDLLEFIESVKRGEA